MQLTSHCEKIIDSLKEKRSFRLLAGPGAGKTKTLIDTLEYILLKRQTFLENDQKIAVITFTNAAKDEILERLGDNQGCISCSTIHSFCWERIKNYKKNVQDYLQRNQKENPLTDSFFDKPIDYRGTPFHETDEVILLGHDEVLDIAVTFLSNPKFREILSQKFPVIFVDEYQDTNPKLLKGLISQLAGKGVVFGLFGDDWQRIYEESLSPIRQELLHEFQLITINENYRSKSSIVELLGRLRPEYQQVSRQIDEGSSPPTLFIYQGSTKEKKHFKKALQLTIKYLENQGWTFSGENAAAVLQLTRKKLAIQLNFADLDNIYSDPSLKTRLIDLKDPTIDFCISVLEPALSFYLCRHTSRAIALLGLTNLNTENKKKVRALFEELLKERNKLSTHEVLEKIFVIKGISSAVSSLEEKLNLEKAQGKYQQENRKLSSLPFKEIIAFYESRKDENSSGTQHSSKGRQFSKVLVVCTENTWKKYNFKEYFGHYQEYSKTLTFNKEMKPMIMARNLFYVSCSRAKEELAVLIDSSYSTTEQDNLKEIFGQNVVPLNSNQGFN